MDGILNIHKEAGYTSHDVVAKLRGICRQRKIGHTGTLDPDATGVLPVCLGKATKVCEYLTEHDKTYEATVLLGITTDTQDMSGKVISKKPATVSEKKLRQVICSYIGESEQVPPMYSAIKIQGKRLYELARQGIEIERKARKIIIYSIENIFTEPAGNEFRMTVCCSKGTYIRTLCHDIGEKLGCGAVMKSLTRTKSGIFTIKKAITLSEAENLMMTGKLEASLIKIEEVFPDLIKAKVSSEAEKYLQNGNTLKTGQVLHGEKISVRDKIRVYDSSGEFKAIYEFQGDETGYKVVKMF